MIKEEIATLQTAKMDNDFELIASKEFERPLAENSSLIFYKAYPERIKIESTSKQEEGDMVRFNCDEINFTLIARRPGLYHLSFTFEKFRCRSFKPKLEDLHRMEPLRVDWDERKFQHEYRMAKRKKARMLKT